MRYRKTVLRAGAVASMLLLAVACAKAPTAKINLAEQALSDARNAEAATYAGAEWSNAQAAMTAAKAEIAAQEAKFAMLRSYSKAVEMLTTAENLARTAEQAGIAGRDKARQEADSMLAQVRTDLETANTLLAALGECPSKPKGFSQDLELLQGNLQGLSDSLPEIDDARSTGRFEEAKTLASSLRTEVSALVADLGSAKAKIKC